MSGISDYHGPVSKCTSCRNAEGQEQSCPNCFSRGYVAQCLGCDGKGHTIIAMAGGPGTMKSVCAPCGGRGSFGVNKPANWQEPESAIKGELATA